MTNSTPTLNAAALQRHYEDLVLNAIRAGDYSKPDTWFALNSRMAFSMARKVVEQSERNLVHRDQAAQEVSRWKFPLRTCEEIASANIGSDYEERL